MKAALVTNRGESSINIWVFPPPPPPRASSPSSTQSPRMTPWAGLVKGSPGPAPLNIEMSISSRRCELLLRVFKSLCAIVSMAWIECESASLLRRISAGPASTTPALRWSDAGVSWTREITPCHISDVSGARADVQTLSVFMSESAGWKKTDRPLPRPPPSTQTQTTGVRGSS